jgi:hypothetical protein
MMPQNYPLAAIYNFFQPDRKISGYLFTVSYRQKRIPSNENVFIAGKDDLLNAFRVQ